MRYTHRARSLGYMLGVMSAGGRVSDSLPHCSCCTAFPGSIFRDPHLYMEAERKGGFTPPATAPPEL